VYNNTYAHSVHYLFHGAWKQPFYQEEKDKKSTLRGFFVFFVHLRCLTPQMDISRPFSTVYGHLTLFQKEKGKSPPEGEFLPFCLFAVYDTL
jgi:hypothetical protein